MTLCGWVRGHCSGWIHKKIPAGVNVVYFLLQVAIVFASTHHMTPGHSLLIRVVLDPPLPPSQRHTHTITHSDAHNGLLVIPTECTGSLPFRFELTKEGLDHDVGTAPHVSPADPKSSSVQLIDTTLISSN